MTCFLLGKAISTKKFPDCSEGVIGWAYLPTAKNPEKKIRPVCANHWQYLESQQNLMSRLPQEKILTFYLVPLGQDVEGWALVTEVMES